MFKSCQDILSKFVKYSSENHLTKANMFSILSETKLICLVKPVARHGNGVSARANRKAARKYSDTKKIG